MYRYLILSIILSIFLFHAFAQQTISREGPERTFQEALQAFQNDAFGAATLLFSQYLDQPGGGHRTEAFFYRAYAKLKTGDQSGIRDMETFMSMEKNHPLAISGYFLMGNHFFAESAYERALDYYNKVDRTRMNAKDQEELHFKRGYGYLVTSEENKAQAELQSALDYRGDFFIATSYYLGQLYYQNRNYNSALNTLEPIDGRDSPYKDEITTLVASCYFQQRNYSRLYAYAEKRQTSTINTANKTLSRLTGEAYFNQEKYPQAARNLQRHVDFSRNKAEASVYFKLGFAYFQGGENQKAIDYFKLAGLEKGDLGQASSFYLGQLYLRTNNPDYAGSAFRNVIKSGSNEKMKEEAAFLVGKVSYQRKQYAEAINDLKSFLEAYPRSLWAREANELLAQSYLSTSNYDQAISHLEQIRNKSLPLKKAWQKVTFQKGQLQFNDSHFSEAAKSFERSVLYPIDEEMAGEAYYLLGESYSQAGNDAKAIEAYQRVRQYSGSTWALYADYGLAYIYYNQRNYTQAETYFSKFTSRVSNASDYYLDAALRLADCKYVQKKYSEAIRMYDEVKSQTSWQRDYIFYQLGLAWNLNGDKERSRAAFRNVLNESNSAYTDNALFQLAQTFIQEGEFSQALPFLNRLITQYPNTNLTPYARAERALCYFNMDQLQNSQSDYEYILKNNLSHPAANAALLGLQEVVKKGHKVPDFETHMEAYRQANPDDSSLEVVAFESAKAKYYNQEYSDAISSLRTFISKYPDSGVKEDAYYFLADACFRKQDWDQAIQYFDQLIGFESTAYLSRALDKKGKALVSIGDFEQAVTTYKQLELKGMNPRDIYNAREGLMNAYFSAGKMDSTRIYANRILESDWKPANAQTQAWMIKGKAFLQEKNYSAALDEFIKVVNESKNEHGAEAKYFIGKVYFEQKDYKRSLEALFDLNRNYASYQYWVGKSFLLVADNYFALGELLQAEATLNSIIENATLDEVVSAARNKLKKVRQATDEVLVQDSTKTDTIR